MCLSGLLTNEVFLVILDKILLGAVVLLVGYKFSKYLENYKLNEALKNNFEKDRLSKINELWGMIIGNKELIYQGIANSSKLALQSNVDVGKKMQEELTPYTEKFNRNSEIINQKLLEYKYWLGDEVFEEFKNFHDSLVEFLISFTKLDQYEAKRKRKEIDENTPNYHQIIKKHFGINMDTH